VKLIHEPWLAPMTRITVTAIAEEVEFCVLSKPVKIAEVILKKHSYSGNRTSLKDPADICVHHQVITDIPDGRKTGRCIYCGQEWLYNKLNFMEPPAVIKKGDMSKAHIPEKEGEMVGFNKLVYDENQGKFVSPEETRGDACMEGGAAQEKKTPPIPSAGKRGRRGKYICPQCGGPKHSASSICAKCKQKQKQKDICPECGGEKIFTSALCRSCHAKIKAQPAMNSALRAKRKLVKEGRAAGAVRPQGGLTPPLYIVERQLRKGKLTIITNSWEEARKGYEGQIGE